MKLIYGIHIMWYEVGLLQEHFESLRQAVKHTNLPVEIVVCANKQTYIEKPDTDDVMSNFTDTLNNILSTFDNVYVYYKTDEDSFYNIGDFRRELIAEDSYVIWGETDCLIPKNYFGILESLSNEESFNHPHVVTLSSRKMWDSTWIIVEHMELREQLEAEVGKPFHHNDYITQDQLDEFNDKFEVLIEKTPLVKLDGALVALRSGLPKLIPDDMHFAREDYIAQCVLNLHSIPQYHLLSVMKGHNYKHPNKRKNTQSSRDDSVYKVYEAESYKAGVSYLSGLTGMKP